jgi:hypothetical protein
MASPHLFIYELVLLSDEGVHFLSLLHKVLSSIHLCSFLIFFEGLSTFFHGLLHESKVHMIALIHIILGKLKDLCADLEWVLSGHFVVSFSFFGAGMSSS